MVVGLVLIVTVCTSAEVEAVAMVVGPVLIVTVCTSAEVEAVVTEAELQIISHHSSIEVISATLMRYYSSCPSL
jgi:hypothetical protein